MERIVVHGDVDAPGLQKYHGRRDGEEQPLLSSDHHVVLRNLLLHLLHDCQGKEQHAGQQDDLPDQKDIADAKQ